MSAQSTRQPADVIERLGAAVEAARDQRDAAKDCQNSAAYLLAHALMSGMTRDDAPEWVQEYRDASVSAEKARDAWMAARVEWYHARGLHASENLALCCKEDGS